MKKRVIAAILCVILILSSCSIEEAGDSLVGFANRFETAMLMLFNSEENFVKSRKNFLPAEDNRTTLSDDFMEMIEELPPIEERFGYRSLAENEKILYNRIYDSALSLSTFVDVYDLDIDKYRVGEIYKSVVSDCPELFYLQSNYKRTLYYDSSVALIFLSFYDGETVDRFNEDHTEFTAEASRIKISQCSDELANKVEELCLQTEDLSLEAKVRYVHDMIASTVVYDDDYAIRNDTLDYEENASNAYGCLVEKKAVCGGYSEGAALLLSALGIENTVCYGKVDDAYHEWNIVKLGDTYYHMDVTWGEPLRDGNKDWIRYEYYLLSDDQISETHTIITESNLDEGIRYFPKPDCPDGSRRIFDSIAVDIESSPVELAHAVGSAMHNDIKYIVLIASEGITKAELDQIANKTYYSQVMALARSYYGKKVSFKNTYSTTESRIYFPLNY